MTRKLSQFFTPVYLTEAQLSSGQLAVKQKYQNSAFTQSLQLVQVGNLPQLQQGGIMPLYLPGNPNLYEFAASHVESTSGGDFVWMGELITRDSCNGEVVEEECYSGFIISLAVSSLNQSFRNSDINNSELTVVLAGTQLLTTAQFSESNDLRDDAYSLVANGTVAAARASMHADIVVVMTDTAYANGDGAVTTFGDFPTAKDSAFAIVEAQSANQPNYTFHHEVAHLFGARHQDSDNCHLNHDDSGLSYAHGYAFNKGCHCFLWDNKKYYHTIVSACYDNGERQKIPHYSNPNVKYKGKKTGTGSTNDNAKVLRDAACRVGSYVLTDNPSVWISGFNRMCPGEINFLGGVVEGVPGPYSYEWYVSDDGFDWGSSVSTAGGIEIVMPAQPGDKVFIKLIAGNVSGPMMTAYKSVKSDTSGLLCWRGWAGNQGASFAPSLQIFPNPATADALTLRWQGDNSGANTVLIFDSFGRAVGRLSRQVAEGENEMHLNVGHLPNGVYWLRLQSKSFDNSLRFTLIR